MRALTKLTIFTIFALSDALPGHHPPPGDWDIKIHTKRGKLGGELTSLVIFPSSIPNNRLGRTIDCRLSLHENGTFSLTPKDAARMPIHGRWEIGKNPYCPTDRFYDDLLLRAYPRVQKRQDIELQRVRFQFKCRIYGLYYEKNRERISHGTLLWQDQTSSNDKDENLNRWWRKTRVCATFLGRPVMESKL